MDQSPGPARASIKTAGRILAVLLVVGFLMIVMTVIWLLAGNLNGVMRVVISALMAVGLAWFGIGFFLHMGNPPPPDPEPVKVDPRLRLNYVCGMCGLELAVVMASKERAPRHCGEAMDLVRRPPEG